MVSANQRGVSSGIRTDPIDPDTHSSHSHGAMEPRQPRRRALLLATLLDPAPLARRMTRPLGRAAPPRSGRAAMPAADQRRLP
eukprot:6237310-Pyramimonas_sp.AAC.1